MFDIGVDIYDFFNNVFSIKHKNFLNKIEFNLIEDDIFLVDFFYVENCNKKELRKLLNRFFKSFIFNEDFNLIHIKKYNKYSVKFSHKLFEFNQHNFDLNLLEKYNKIDINKYYENNIYQRRKLKLISMEKEFIKNSFLTRQKRYVNHFILKKNKDYLMLQVAYINFLNNHFIIDIYFIKKNIFFEKKKLFISEFNLYEDFNLKLNEEEDFKFISSFLVEDFDKQIRLNNSQDNLKFNFNIKLNDLNNNKFLIKKILIDFMNFSF